MVASGEIGVVVRRGERFGGARPATGLCAEVGNALTVVRSFRRFDALLVSAPLTFAVAVFAHTLVHAVGAGASFALLTPAHVVMLAVAAVGLVFAARGLGIGGSSAEVRRRTALFGASFRSGRASLARAIAVQAALVTALLVFENASIAPERLLEATMCGAVAACAAALVARWFQRRLPTAIRALYATHRAIDRLAAQVPEQIPLLAPRIAVARVRPVRAPPIS